MGGRSAQVIMSPPSVTSLSIVSDATTAFHKQQQRSAIANFSG